MIDPRGHWLVKTDAGCFAWKDLWRAPKRTTCWDGVRNYQARNMLRDQMKRGDLVLFYHSSAEPSAIVGVCEIAREAYPDPTAFNPQEEHFDPKSDPEAPTWFAIDLRAVAPFKRPLPLPELRGVRGLERMELLRKGSRLSVMPVTAKEWAIVIALAE